MTLNEFQEELFAIMSKHDSAAEPTALGKVIQMNPGTLKIAREQIVDKMAPLFLACSTLGFTLEDIAQEILNTAEYGRDKSKIPKKGSSQNLH